jgi:ribosomal protein S18 acetylase RimI-like enzyme
MELRVLSAADLPSILAFLRTEPVENVALLDRFRTEGLSSGPYQESIGVWSGDRWLGLAHFGGDVSLFVPHLEAMPLLAEYAVRRTPVLPRVIAREATVQAYRQHFEVLGLPLLFDRPQRVLSLRPGQLSPSAPPDPGLRLARLEECDAQARIAAAMSLEEIQMDPLEAHPTAYPTLIAMRIMQRRYYLVARGGETVFQAHLNALCPEGGQVTGVYVPPPFRGQGLGKAGMAEFARRVLELTPVLSLFVNESNVRALALYRGLGFQDDLAYRAIFWAEPRP